MLHCGRDEYAFKENIKYWWRWNELDIVNAFLIRFNDCAIVLYLLSRVLLCLSSFASLISLISDVLLLFGPNLSRGNKIKTNKKTSPSLKATRPQLANYGFQWFTKRRLNMDLHFIRIYLLSGGALCSGSISPCLGRCLARDPGKGPAPVKGALRRRFIGGNGI